MDTATSSGGSWNPVWEATFAKRGWGRYPPEAVIRAMSRAYRPEARVGVRVLDVGAGAGANTWFLAREGFAVSAIDGSETGIAQAGARLRDEGLAAELVVGDFTRRLPWADATFDAVLDNASIYANPMPAIEAALAEVHRVLKPGGLFVSLSFTDRTWGYGEGRPDVEPGGFTEVHAGPLARMGHVQFFGRRDIDRLFARYARVGVERQSYTLEQGLRTVEYWVVEARKAG